MPNASRRLRQPSLRFLALFATALPAIAANGAALAQSKPLEQCSLAFHGTFKTGAQPAFSALMDATRSIIRAPDKSLPGRWLMTPTRVINAKAKPVAPERVCAEETERNGRKRCLRFVDKPIGIELQDFEPRLAVPGEDLALFRAVTDIAESRGIPPELGPNGRHAQVYQRLLNEMTGYVAQPAHPALCNGVPYMLDFYAKELSGLKTRIKTVGAQAQKFEELLAQRVSALRTLVGPAPISSAAPEASPTPEVAIVEALKLITTPEAVQRVEGFSSPLARLQAAKILLIDAARAPQTSPAKAPEVAPTANTPATQTTDASKPVEPVAGAQPQPSAEHRIAAIRLLRFAEATIYARIHAERLNTLNARMDDLLDGLRKNHAEHCLCSGE